MNFNIDCFRDTLKFCIENIDYDEDGENWDVKCVNLNTLYDANELKKYPKKEIMLSVVQLNECGFIKVLSKFPENKPYLNRCSIEGITFNGYQFFELVREHSVWEKTKSIANKFGNHTLKFIEDIAHDIAVESAKQAVTMMMVKNQ